MGSILCAPCNNPPTEDSRTAEEAVPPRATDESSPTKVANEEKAELASTSPPEPVPAAPAPAVEPPAAQSAVENNEQSDAWATVQDAPDTKPAAPEASKQEAAPVHWMQAKWNEHTQGSLGEKEKTFIADVKSQLARRPSSENVGFPEYADKHKALFDRVRSLEEPTGWVDKKKGFPEVDIYQKSVEGSDNVYTKGVCKMKTHGNGIFHLIANLLTAEDRPKYDEVCSHGASLESFLPWYRIVYFRLITPAMIASRDVCTLSRICFEQDGSLLIATESVDHPDAPETSSYVRAKILAGYMIRPTSDPDEWTITFVVCSDPGGWLPGWVKNLIAWKAQLMLVAFKKHYDTTFGKKASS